MSKELLNEVNNFKKQLEDVVFNDPEKKIVDILNIDFRHDQRFLAYAFWNISRGAKCVTPASIEGFWDSKRHGTIKKMGMGLGLLVHKNTKHAKSYFMDVLTAVQADSNFFLSSSKGLILLKCLVECDVIPWDLWMQLRRRILTNSEEYLKFCARLTGEVLSVAENS